MFYYDYNVVWRRFLIIRGESSELFTPDDFRKAFKFFGITGEENAFGVFEADFLFDMTGDTYLVKYDAESEKVRDTWKIAKRSRFIRGRFYKPASVMRLFPERFSQLHRLFERLDKSAYVYLFNIGRISTKDMLWHLCFEQVDSLN